MAAVARVGDDAPSQVGAQSRLHASGGDHAAACGESSGARRPDGGGGQEDTCSEHAVEVGNGRPSVTETVRDAARPLQQALENEVASKRCGSCLFNPRVRWRHPLARMAVTWVILAEDFFIYGEDPVNDSHVTANFPGMGHILGILAVHAAPSAGLAFLKVFLIALAIAGGIFLGRLFLCRVVRQRLQLIAFEGCEGALLVVAVASCLMLLVASLVYNLCIPEGEVPLSGSSMELLQLFGARSDQYRHINQSFQTLSGWVDLLAIVMIADSVLQDTRRYPAWAPRVKRLWTSGQGWVRVAVAWFVMISGCTTIAVLVFRTGTEGDGIRWTNTTLGGLTEVKRSMLAACIIFTDLLTVAQDWDFPLFREPTELNVPVKIAGTFWSNLRCNCIGALLRRLPRVPFPDCVYRLLPSIEAFQLSINGKWLTYGPLIGVMIIDFLCAKTQLMYDPVNYGQYADPADSRIWVIRDEAYLKLAYVNGVIARPEMVTYAARWNVTTGLPLSASTATDLKLNSKYIGSAVYKWLGLLIALLIFAGFVGMLQAANWRLQHGLSTVEEEEEEVEREEGEGSGPEGGVPAEQPPEGAAAGTSGATAKQPAEHLRDRTPAGEGRGPDGAGAGGRSSQPNVTTSCI
uniref:Uncharacterized protein n=1 Tax=Alexandrium monilatum TaxID=311494 RepID=A0A7S4VPP4_9DINO